MNKCKLGDLFYIKQGYAFQSKKYVSKSPYILCTLGNFSDSNNFKFNPEKATYYPDDFSHEFILQENDLIIPLTEQVIGLFGNTAFVPKTNNFQFVLNQRVGKIIPYDGKADKVFLHYLLSTQSVRDQIEATASGTKQRNTSPDKIYDVTVWVPCIEVQQAIGNFLYQLEQKCNTNTEICSELEAMVKALYDYWFVQFDFPDENGRPYRTSGGEMVWNEQLKREIPKGWGSCKLRDYANNIINSTASGEHLNGLFYTPIDEIPKRQMSFYGGLSYTEANSSLQLYEENDILIGAMRVYFHRVCIAAQQGITRSTTMILRTKDDNLLGFVYELFNQDQTIQYASKISVGTQQPYVNWEGALDSMNVIAPDRSVVLAFCEYVNPIIEKIKCVVKENYELTRLRDWFLPMLMNGQASVE